MIGQALQAARARGELCWLTYRHRIPSAAGPPPGWRLIRELCQMRDDVSGFTSNTGEHGVPRRSVSGVLDATEDLKQRIAAAERTR